MNGEGKSLEDRTKEIETAVQDYFNKLKLPTDIDQEIVKPLNLTISQIRTLTSTECFEWAYVLDRHALFLQQEYNFHSARNSWAEHNLYIAISNAIRAQSWGTYIKFEEKKMIVEGENTYCQLLSKMVAACQMKMESLNSLSMKVNTIAKTLKDAGYSKRREHD